MDYVLEDRRFEFANRVQIAQDVIGVLVLAPAAAGRLQGGSVQDILLGLTEVAAIGLAVLSARAEFSGKHESSPHVDWTNLFVGIAMMLEYVFSLESGRKWFSPLFLTAIVILVLAFVRPRLLRMRTRRRFLRVDENGIEIRQSRFRTFSAPWTDIERIESSATDLVIHLANGESKTIRLKRYRNRDELRNAVLQAAPQAALQR